MTRLLKRSTDNQNHKRLDSRANRKKKHPQTWEMSAADALRVPILTHETAAPVLEAEY